MELAQQASTGSTPGTMGVRLRIGRLSLLAVMAASLVFATLAPRADAMSYGFDSSGAGHVGAPHAWIIMSDAELIREGARAAASQACSRMIGAAWSGSPCGQAVDQMLRTVDWRGFNDRGAFAEVSVWPYRTYIGRW